jgi:glycosyltransferase involved in cell wall biosynthesis
VRVLLDNTRSALSPYGGVGHVGLDFFLALKRHAPGVTPHFLYRRGEPVSEQDLAYLRSRGCDARAYHPRLALHLPLRARVLHSTYHKLPSLPFHARIVHVHDVWTLRANPYQSREFQERRAARFRRVLERADLFTTMSRTVRDELLAETDIASERVSVVGYGNPHDLEEPQPDPDPEVRPDPPYVLAVARVEVRKNLEHTARAVASLTGLRLVLIGGQGFGGQAIAAEHLEPLREQGRLDWRTAVGADELRALYRGALALLAPSWEEGFGIPLLEAMGLGLPVITSERSANAEVVGSAGALVDPARWEESAHWLARLRDEPALRDDLRRRGLARAAEFRWADVAARLEALYRSAG